MKIYIINLERDVERKKHMQSLCEKYGLEYTFVKAVNGFELDNGQIESLTSIHDSIKLIGRELSKGEVGCTLSHMKIYKDIIENTLEYALILEDDAVFDERLLDFLNKFEKPKIVWDVLLVGYHNCCDHKNFHLELGPVVLQFNNYKIAKNIDIACGTYAYLVSCTGALNLLEKNKQIVVPIDAITGDSNLVNSFVLIPPIIKVSEKFDKNTPLEKDRTALRKLYAKRERIVNAMIALIKRDTPTSHVVLYGFGTIGKMIVDQLVGFKTNIYIVDKSAKDRIYKEYKILQFGELQINDDVLFINTIHGENAMEKVNNQILDCYPNAKIIDVLSVQSMI